MRHSGTYLGKSFITLVLIIISGGKICVIVEVVERGNGFVGVRYCSKENKGEQQNQPLHLGAKVRRH